MTLLVPLALFGLIPIVVALFSYLPPRRAVIVAFLGAWLFLPMAQYDLPGLPNYGKITATALGALLGTIIFDSGRLASFRPRLADIPALIWCLCPLATSLSNGLGLYDGLSGVFSRCISWGLPYLIGRLYFSDLAGLRELAIGIMVGGLIYVPFCLWEIRFSPQLHRIIYGYYQHSFLQQIRYGGYRPMVFMQHGLAVAVWMSVATFTSFWLWRTRAFKAIYYVPIGLVVIVLLMTAILCKSGNGIVLLALGLGLMAACKWFRTATPLLCVIVAIPLYMGSRFTGLLPREPFVRLAESLSDPERAGSLDARMIQEDLFSLHTYERPWFGWGGWGRNFATDEAGQRLTRGVDSLWIITVSSDGLVGLSSFTAMMLMPPLLFAWRFPVRLWFRPEVIGATIAVVLVVLSMVDNLANGLINPFFILIAGGISRDLIREASHVPHARFLPHRRHEMRHQHPARATRALPPSDLIQRG
jgi:hypothetical protein